MPRMHPDQMDVNICRATARTPNATPQEVHLSQADLLHGAKLQLRGALRMKVSSLFLSVFGLSICCRGKAAAAGRSSTVCCAAETVGKCKRCGHRVSPSEGANIGCAQRL